VWGAGGQAVETGTKEKPKKEKRQVAPILINEGLRGTPDGENTGRGGGPKMRSASLNRKKKLKENIRTVL